MFNVNKEHEDGSLAPRTWDTYIGQEVVKERLRISIEGALSRYEPLKHVLILGQPGCLAGDTVIPINRAGKGFSIKLEDLVHAFNGGTRGGRTWDKNIPTMVQRDNDDGTIRLAKIVNAWESGEKQTYTVTTSTGRSVRATDEHPFKTEEGWFRLDELKVGDLVFVNAGKSSNGRTKILYPDTFTKFHPRQRNTTGGWRVPTHRLAMEAHLNNLAFDVYVDILRNDEDKASSLQYLTSEQAVHHIDGNVKNNDISNLELLTHEQHRAEHDWSNNVLDQVGSEEIISIEPFGVEMTYDIEVEDDPHNFIANGFVVHNTGKTSLAEIIAAEMSADLLALTMTPNFKMQFLYKKIKDFEGGVIFLDEIHTLPKKSQHYLLDVLEKKKMTYDSGKVEYIDKPITFIGATTDPDDLIEPLYDRFPIRHTLLPYSDLEMAKIVERMALQLALYPTKEACMALGRASAGVPRQARRLVFAAQDVGGLDNVDEILSACGITPEGLTEDHLAYMRSLYELGGKAGIVNLANHSGRPRDIVERLEKLLVTKAYVEITPSGRVLSYDGMKALKEALS